jgi:hypothetical protein
MEFISLLAVVAALVMVAASLLLFARYHRKEDYLRKQAEILEQASSISVDAPKKLVAHTKEFRQGVVTIKDRIHVAMGYALAHSILIEGNYT